MAFVGFKSGKFMLLAFLHLFVKHYFSSFSTCLLDKYPAFVEQWTSFGKNILTTSALLHTGASIVTIAL